MRSYSSACAALGDHSGELGNDADNHEEHGQRQANDRARLAGINLADQIWWTPDLLEHGERRGCLHQHDDAQNQADAATAKGEHDAEDAHELDIGGLLGVIHGRRAGRSIGSGCSRHARSLVFDERRSLSWALTGVPAIRERRRMEQLERTAAVLERRTGGISVV